MSETPRHKELEEQWRQNKEARKRKGSEALVWIAQIPPELAAWYRLHSQGVEFKKPKHLRGPALIKELIRLGLEWGDKRFLDCVNAMVEHQVVDQKTYDFTGRHGPHLVEHPQQTEAARRRKEDIACIKKISVSAGAGPGPVGTLGVRKSGRGVRTGCQLRFGERPFEAAISQSAEHAATSARPAG